MSTPSSASYLSPPSSESSLSCDNLVKLLSGHTEPISALRWSPDDRHLATASDDNTLRVWTREGICVSTLTGHTKNACACEWHPDCQRLVSASWDKSLRLWNLNGTCLAVLAGHTDAVLSCAFSPDGETILSSAADHTCRIWSLEGDCRRVLEGHSGSVRRICVSPTGNRVVTASYDHTLKVWTLDGELVATLRGHTDWVKCCAFSPDGTRFVSGSKDRTCIVWDSETLEQLFTLAHQQNQVNAVDFSALGGSRYVAAGSCDDKARVYDLEAGGECIFTYSSHTEDVSDVKCLSGTRVASASRDRTVQYWDFTLGPEAKAVICSGHEDAIFQIALSHDGATLASGSWDCKVGLWTA